MMPYRPLVCLLYLCGYEIAYGFYVDLFPILLRSQLGYLPPPVLKNCPSNIAVTADKGKRSTQVYWTKPTEIHHYRVEHTHQSGEIFYIGKTRVTHVARISNGDYAECSFSITVSVTRCPKMFLSRNVLMLCNHYDQRYGTTCEFECPPGYSIQGYSRIYCTSMGNWVKPPPTCKVTFCPPLGSDTWEYRCTKGSEFGSQCYRICPPGYDIPPGKSRVILCQGNGRWRGTFPDCIDVTNPMMIKCKPFANAVADSNSKWGTITWREPTIIDNADKDIKWTRIGRIAPGDRIEVGTYQVTYTAQDKAGNQAKPCKVELSMKVLTCPSLYNNNFLSVTCPGGFQNGGKCSFSCKIGSELIGQNITTCRESKDKKFASWDFKDKHPYCEVHRRCVNDPDPPKNGAVACDTWLDGKFCQVQCHKDYDFKPGYPFYEMLVCGDSGKWEPETALPIPDCSKTYQVNTAAFKMSSSFYFDGNCMDPKVQEQIQKNYIDSLSNSSFKAACEKYKSQCKMGNVKVICGAVTRKRSAEMKIEVEFVIEADGSQTEQGFEDIQDEMLGVLTNETENGTLAIVLDGNVTLIATDMTAEKVVFQCPNNTFASYKTSSCVECSAGTHYSTTLQSCPQCPKGQYQPSEGQPYCLMCPEGKTTAQRGAKSESECLEACPRGQWSVTGVTPCAPCPLGSYGEDIGSTVCAACPISQTTLTQGSSNITDCSYFDIFLSSSESKAVSDIKLNWQNTSKIVLSSWVRFPIFFNSTSPTLFFRVNGNVEETLPIESTNNTDTESDEIGNILIDEKEWTFVVRSIDIQKFKRLGVNENSTFTITIQGPLVVSQFNIWSASYDEEKLRNESNRCVINETGDVFPWKQWENAHLDGSWIQIPSMCDDINECDEHPCGNNTCNNELGGVTCECNLGYRGTYCEENIDDCLTSICQNNSTCVDGINKYSCICPPNYKGDLCETLFLHGNWSKWDEWSQCSETCGNGTKSRKRYCTNPAPYNGGKFCTGNHTEVTHCNVKECPVCSVPEAPDNGTLNCTGSPHTGFNCTIACNSGFSFDRGVKPYYECGPTTLFLWDFNSDDNPNGDLPTCNPVQESKELSANFRALYEDLYCDEENNDIINAKINVNVELFLEELPCRQKMTCNTTDFFILNCGKEPTRKKRSPDPSKMTAGFQVKFSCSAMTLGSEVCAEELIGAITSFEEPASRSKLAVNVSNTMYEIDSNQTSASGEVQCDRGYVSSGISCVPCGVGNFFLDGLCRKCEYGFYQDELGQTGCKQCPSGTTTPGRASRVAESCSVKMILEEDNSELYTGIGTSIATLVVVVAIMTAVIFKVRKLELKLGEGAVKLQKKDCQPDAFNFQEEDANVVSLCTIRRLDDNGVPLT